MGLWSWLEKQELQRFDKAIAKWVHCSKCGDLMEKGTFMAPDAYSKLTGQPVYVVLAWGCKQIRHEKKGRMGHDFYPSRVSVSEVYLQYIQDNNVAGAQRVLDVFKEESEP